MPELPVVTPEDLALELSRATFAAHREIGAASIVGMAVLFAQIGATARSITTSTGRR